MTEPNTMLKAVRVSMGLSQDGLARALRDAGAPNANKRLVQRWEAGTNSPQPVYAALLEQVCRRPLSSLGFTNSVGGSEPRPAGAPVPQPLATFSGIWLSRYEYPSSSRGGTFEGKHYVVLVQRGDQITVQSIPGSADSSLSMVLTVDGSVLSGTWTEVTARDGYYRGARYHGVVHMLAEPTGRRITGRWLGFGRSLDINDGPWVLTFVEERTDPQATTRYAHPPE